MPGSKPLKEMINCAFSKYCGSSGKEVGQRVLETLCEHGTLLSPPCVSVVLREASKVMTFKAKKIQ